MTNRKARPILFSGPMVRALLEGRKTQTRRVCADHIQVYDTVCPEATKTSFDFHFRNGIGQPVLCPYGQPGDLLWVREGWAITTNVEHLHDRSWPDRPFVNIEALDGINIEALDGIVHEAAIYRADGEWSWCDGDGFSTERSYWKPSIHMPRWASRLTLEITDVRVERLQDVSEEDAAAEGLLRGDPLPEIPESHGVIWSSGVGDLGSPFAWTRNPRQAFMDLWQSINGPASWDANPWVWALTFAVHHQNSTSFNLRATGAVAALPTVHRPETDDGQAEAYADVLGEFPGLATKHVMMRIAPR